MIRNRPPHLSTSASKLFRHAIAGEPTLAEAAKALRGRTDSSFLAPTDIVQGVDDMRRDAGFQTYLNNTDPRGGEAGNQTAVVSPFAATISAGLAEIEASRATTDATLAAGGDTSIATRTTPYGTGLGLCQEVGEQGSVSTMTLSGSKAKTIAFGGGLGGTQVGIGLTLVHEDKVSVLGPEVVGQDGITRRLARFQSKAMPVVDLSLSGAAEALAGGLRVVVGRGKSAVYEKYVPIDELGALLDQRGRWYAPAVATITALARKGRPRLPSRTELAADLGQIGRMAAGESATWQVSHVGMIGVSGGSHGLRASLALSLVGSMTCRLDCVGDGLATLTVRPLWVSSARGSLEAHAVVDLSASYLKAGAQQRSWSFDLHQGAGRLALSNALAGHLPGLLAPAVPGDDLVALAYLADLSSERLPKGVQDLGSEFQSHRQLFLSASGFKLPDLLGASSLNASASVTSSLSGRSADGEATLVHGHEVGSSIELLGLGSVSRTSAMRLTSRVEKNGKAQHLVPTSLETEIVHETANSGALGRRWLAGRVCRDTGTLRKVAKVQPTSRYVAKSVQSLSVPDLEAIGRASSADVDAISRRHSLPSAVLRDVRDAVGGAAGGTHERLTHALKAVAGHSRHGIRALHLLSDATTIKHTFEHAGHNQLLSEFQALETRTLSSKTKGQLKRALQGLDQLSLRTWDAIEELESDGLLALANDVVPDDKAEVLRLLKRETDLLAKAAADALAVDRVR